MRYRQFGNLDWKVSELGFGTMRLPTLSDDTSDIDIEQSKKMLRYAIDNGVNYVDTAWPYHGEMSEPFVGDALQDGYRERVKLATKLPSWLIEERGDMERYLDQQLERLKTDYIDFYLLHTLNREYWENLKELDVFSWLDEMKKKGKIKYAGFSFHDDYELFEEIIDSYDWTFSQIQYNYLDKDFQAGQKGLKYAASKGIAVVIMEPLMGGKLAADPPGSIKKILERSEKEPNPVRWALEWLWDQPEVSVVLSGMSAFDQVKENVELASDPKIGSLTREERSLVEEVGRKYNELSPVECTGCNYCMPCPNGVQIPQNFRLYNDAEVYGRFEKNKSSYFDMDEGKRASACIECGQCEEACPQNLPVMELLKETHNYFS